MVIGSGAVTLVLTSVSCLDPTQITVTVETDVRCSDTKGTSFVGGKPGGVELASPTTTTRECVDGRIGTLVSTPSGGKDADAAFVVVLGVDRPVSECTAANHWLGCIVERRLIEYITHTPLNLPVTMWLVCKDVECGTDTTCARNGKCVSARIADPARCADGPCFLEGEGPLVPGGDGGPGTDGPLQDGAVTDSRIGDGAPDAPLVIPPPPPDGKLFCPPIPDGCAAGGPCCFSHAGPGGRCAQLCDPMSETTMRCNRKSDCGAADSCCGNVTTTSSAAVVRQWARAFSPAGPDAMVADAAVISTRTLTSTSCSNSAAACPGAWICTQPSDCPPPFLICDKGSALFNPPGLFGECK